MAELKQFVDDNFDQAGIDLLPHSPADWPETLPFYGQIRDAKSVLPFDNPPVCSPIAFF